jgi:SNF2 family DNA or RNA helicase
MFFGFFMRKNIGSVVVAVFPRFSQQNDIPSFPGLSPFEFGKFSMHASKKIKGKPTRRKQKAAPVPPSTDWRTTDDHEIIKRQLRAREEIYRIANSDPEHAVFSNFEVRSPSGMTYQVELRDLVSRQFSCTCTDFRINGLGTCKHVEAILLHLARRQRAEFKGAGRITSARIDIVPDQKAQALRVERGLSGLPPALRGRFDEEGLQLQGIDPEELLQEIMRCPGHALRVSQDVAPWLDSRRLAQERLLLRRDYEAGVIEGRHPEHVTLSPLFPYQREGMLHLAFSERALLADEMGLGKTIQAIAACALLRHLGRAARVLIVTPASLKAEWEEQISKFTTLPLRLVYGGRDSTAIPPPLSSQSSTTSRSSLTRSTSTSGYGPTSSFSTKPSESRTGPQRPRRR